MISIINYGLGNLGSIRNMFRHIGKPAQIIDRPDQLKEASKLLLPGVGSFDAGMQLLEKNGWIEPLNKMVLEDRMPILGICLGMQLMTERSQEGKNLGLGWIEADVLRFQFPDNPKLKVPHMGWNEVAINKDQQLLDLSEEQHRFYFVHSYYVALKQREDALLTTSYGVDFVSGFQKDNILGVQFHPEKSHKFGMELLRNFADRF